MDEIKYSVRVIIEDTNKCPQECANILVSKFGEGNVRVRNYLVRVIETERENIMERLNKCDIVTPTIYNRVLTIYNCYAFLSEKDVAKSKGEFLYEEQRK